MNDGTRRTFLQGAAAVAALTAAGGLSACAGEPPPPAAPPEPAAPPVAKPTPPPAAPAGEPTLVDPQSTLAQTLKYVEDASTVDAAANPTFKPGSHCATCQLYTGAADAESGPCTLFQGQLVHTKGWCASWVAKV